MQQWYAQATIPSFAVVAPPHPAPCSALIECQRLCLADYFVSHWSRPTPNAAAECFESERAALCDATPLWCRFFSQMLMRTRARQNATSLCHPSASALAGPYALPQPPRPQNMYALQVDPSVPFKVPPSPRRGGAPPVFCAWYSILSMFSPRALIYQGVSVGIPSGSQPLVPPPPLTGCPRPGPGNQHGQEALSVVVAERSMGASVLAQPSDQLRQASHPPSGRAARSRVATYSQAPLRVEISFLHAALCPQTAWLRQ